MTTKVLPSGAIGPGGTSRTHDLPPRAGGHCGFRGCGIVAGIGPEPMVPDRPAALPSGQGGLRLVVGQVADLPGQVSDLPHDFAGWVERPETRPPTGAERVRRTGSSPTSTDRTLPFSSVSPLPAAPPTASTRSASPVPSAAACSTWPTTGTACRCPARLASFEQNWARRDDPALFQRRVAVSRLLALRPDRPMRDRRRGADAAASRRTASASTSASSPAGCSCSTRG